MPRQRRSRQPLDLILSDPNLDSRLQDVVNRLESVVDELQLITKELKQEGEERNSGS